jgi:nickel transport protein
MAIKPSIVLCVLAALILIASPALAHKVSVFGYVEGGMLLGEGYFPGGGKAKNSKVELIDQNGKVLATTTTDNKGAFKLKLPAAKAPLKLVVTASMGHKGEYVLTDQDLGQDQKTAKAAQDKMTAGSIESSGDAQAAKAGQIDQATLQAALQKALDKELSPLKAQIAKMQADRGIGVADVIGGLGYILGLLGLAAYMRYRKTEQK